MNVTDIILHQWLSIPEYLHKMSKTYAYKSHSYRNNFLLRFRTENRIVKDSFSVIMCCYAGYLLKICSERRNKILNICTCNISAMCTEMMNIYNDMIGL